MDVYWFPIVTEEFCDDLIAMMEDYGEWSGGRYNHKDTRLSGGYENVPTVDIHLKQIGFEKYWDYFLKNILNPIVQEIFTGYTDEVTF